MCNFCTEVFHYNAMIATYNPTKSPLCDFCGLSPETYIHLFWDCKYSAPLWTALQTISYDHVDMEDFSQFKCILSNFQHPLLNLLATLVKNYIHVCKWTSRLPDVPGLLKAVDRTRNIHHRRCQCKRKSRSLLQTLGGIGL